MGKPVANVTVRVLETDAGVPGIYQTTTNGHGGYTVPLYPGSYTGRYTIDVFGPGIQPAEKTISPIPPGVMQVTQDITVTRLAV